MNSILKLCIFILSFYSVESFIKPLFLKNNNMNNKIVKSMCKHDFSNIGKSLSISDKYFLIQSLINEVLLKKNHLLFNYCYKKFNYTDISHIVISSDLEYIIKKYYDKNTTLELYDIITQNSKLTDCYIKIHRMPLLK